MKTNKLYMLIIIVCICLPLFTFLNLIPPAHAVTNTITVYSTEHSGHIYATNADYGTARNATTGTVQESTNTTMTLGTGQFYAGGDVNLYFVYRGFLFFDTSVIPAGATIDNATLHLYIDTVIATGDVGPTIVIAGSNLSSPHDPLVSTDYACAVSGSGGQANTTVSSIWLNLTVTSDGLNWIVPYGETKLVLRTSDDIANSWIGDNYVSYKTITAGVAYAPNLEITYTASTTYTYIFHGPYTENGQVYNGIINVSLSYTDQAPYVFIMNGSSGTAQTVTVNSALQALALYWNITANYEHSRQYAFGTGLFDEVWLYVPTSTDVVAMYSVTVTDFAGLTGAFVETDKNVLGYNRIVEREHLDVLSGQNFWLVMYSQYTLKVTSDQGTFSWSLSADSVATKGFMITKDMVATSFNNMNSTVNATRLSGSSLNVYFYDANSTTTWINTTVYLMNTTGLFAVASQLDNGNLQNYTLSGLTATSDYLVYIVALQNGTQQTWTFTLPKLPTSTNPWTGLFNGFSTDSTIRTLLSNGVAIFVVVMFFAIGSWKDTEWFLGTGIVFAGFFVYIGWLQIPVAGVSMALLVVVAMYIHKGKQESREF